MQMEIQSTHETAPVAAPEPQSKTIAEAAPGSMGHLVQIVDHIGGLSQRLVTLSVCGFVLCCAGTADLVVGNTQYHMEEGDLFICRPSLQVEGLGSSNNFACCGVLVPQEFFERNIVFAGSMWDTLNFLDNNPILRLNGEECYMFRQYCSLIKTKLNATPLRHHEEVIDSLVRALVYELGDRLVRFYKPAETTYNSAENLFDRFMRLLVGSYPKPREVKDYASRLCVTPKYLSAVCKSVTGKPASDVIAKYILQDIKFHLRRKDKSIKEIATELGISNLSYFGKYVRRELGMSPRAYRNSIIGEHEESEEMQS